MSETPKGDLDKWLWPLVIFAVVALAGAIAWNRYVMDQSFVKAREAAERAGELSRQILEEIGEDVR